jgi:transposase
LVGSFAAQQALGLGQIIRRLAFKIGGFEITVAAALSGAKLPPAMVNPRQIRDCARAFGRLAKTHALDAQVIALFAERVRPEPRPRSGCRVGRAPAPDP